MLKTFGSLTVFCILVLGCANNTEVLNPNYQNKSVIYQFENATFELKVKQYEIEAKCVVKNTLGELEMTAAYQSCESLWQFELNHMKNLNVAKELTDEDKVFFTRFLSNIPTATGNEVNLVNKVFKRSIADNSTKTR